MKTRNFVVILCVAMVMVLTACGNKEDKLSDGLVAVEQLPIETESQKQDEFSYEPTNEPEMDTSDNDKVESAEQSGNNSDTKQEEADDELEDNLAKYRAEREKMTNVSLGSGVSGYGAPNAEDYGFSSDESEYLLQFDSRELSEAYETAKQYVTDTLEISVETKGTVYPCVDSRITEIYEADDKGVANGYESENIFVCEYCDEGNWKYLILVREAKGEEWKVIHHGNSYKE